VVEPFHSLIGVNVASPGELKEALRGFVRECRRVCYSGNVGEEDRSVPNPLAYVQQMLGAGIAGALERWFAQVYCESPGEHVVLRGWTLVLRAARRDDRAWDQLNLPPGLSHEARQRFNRSVDASEFYSLCDQVFSRPLSDWDLHLYTINYWDDDSLDAPNGPKSKMYPLFVTARGRSFWGWLLPQLSSSEMSSLHRGGQGLVQTTQELGYIHELAPPDSVLLPPP
jgi:hypothetical protein